MADERSRILEMVAQGKVTVEEAGRLLDAVGGGASESRVGVAVSEPRGKVRYLRVTVVSTDGDNVNVRVPLGLLRAGMKLTSLIPPHAVDTINSRMRDHGMPFDLNSLKPDDIEALIDSLGEMEVNVDSRAGDKVRVFCE